MLGLLEGSVKLWLHTDVVSLKPSLFTTGFGQLGLLGPHTSAMWTSPGSRRRPDRRQEAGRDRQLAGPGSRTASSEPTRILMRQMMSAFAQYEKSMIVAKLRGARQRTKAKTGRCEGVKPYGTLADEQTVLSRICALHAQGRTLVAISEALNAEGIMPRRGAKWYPSSVRNVILREGTAA